MKRKYAITNRMNIEKIEELAGIIIKVKLNTVSFKERELLNEWLFASDTNLKIYSMIMSGDFLASKYMMEEEITHTYNISNIKREIIKKITTKSQKSRFNKFAAIFTASAAVLALMFTGYFIYNNMNDPLLREQSLEAAKAIASKIEPFTDSGKVILETYAGDKIELKKEADAVAANKSAMSKLKTGNETKKHLNTLTTPRGMTFTLTLSDGTKVWMNENSKIVYPVEFSKNRREVIVEGEAYFEVISDSLAPFHVIGKKGGVRVLGTKFNFVSSEEQVITTLVEGSVEVNSPTSKIKITPSQQAVIGSDIQVSEVDVSVITAWKDGKYIFKSKPLSEVMEYLASWYNIKIEYDSSVKKELKLSGVIIKFTTFAEVIEVLEATKQISIKVKDENTIKIFAN